MNESITQRISSEGQCQETPNHSLLEQAEAVAQRVLESIQAIARTTHCKGVQIARLKDWAIEQGCWIESMEMLGTFADRGSENEVYLSKEKSQLVYKLNDFRYSDDNLCPFFFRLKAQQLLFPDCSYDLVNSGFYPEMDGEYYTNGQYDIFDASPNNVLVGIDGYLYFIDTIIYQASDDNYSIYKSQSPKYLKTD